MKILVTGRAGSGKTAVSKELQSRGLTAYDTDKIVGLSAWWDRNTGQKTQFTDNSYIDQTKYAWLWDKNVLVDLLEALETDIFICGGADNENDFENLFDKHFFLSVSPNTQIARLGSRTDNDYGKNPAMHQTILDEQASQLKIAYTLDQIIIDADQPIEKVVDDIIKVAYDT